jgi:hypothetical protein
MNKLNIIWCISQGEIDFSFDWINEILSSFDITHYNDISKRFDIFKDNSVIVVCVDKEPNIRLIEYINTYNDKNLNYTILHLSDEAFEQNIDFYKYSNKIVRNYYNEEYVKEYNILTIPLGYQTSVKYTDTEKSINVNFIGQLKSDRHEMLRNFNQIDSKFIHLTRMWNDPQGLNIKQYSDILSKSCFTLCPRGWISLDSFRVNEALECKSIPVSILDNDGSDYFEKIYGKHPFIIGKDWSDSYEKTISQNIEEKLNEINSWWNDFKDGLKIKLEKYINNDNLFE